MEFFEITQNHIKRFHPLRDLDAGNELISRESNLYTKEVLGVKESENKPYTTKVIHQLNHIWQKYTNRPVLEMAIIPLGGESSSSKWGNLAGETVPAVFKATWRFHLVLFNHSQYEAYHPVIHFNMTLPYFLRLSVLNRYVPILPNGQVIIEGEYSVLEESNTGYPKEPLGIPPFVNQLRVLIEYENNRQRRFYTLFEVKTGFNYPSTQCPLGFVRQ